MSASTCRSVSATYQWGGVARVDLVSAPPGTALAFYGPPALRVHALPLVGPEELVQSTAALTAQHDSEQPSSAQTHSADLSRAQHDDISQHGTAQHIAKPDAALQPSTAQLSASRHNQAGFDAIIDLEASHGHIPDQLSTNDRMLDRHEPPSSSSSSSFSSSSSSLNHVEAPVEQQEESEAPPQQHWESEAHPQQHVNDIRQEASGDQQHVTAPRTQTDEEDVVDEEEEEDSLFAETSVIARGGLRMMQKVTHAQTICMYGRSWWTNP